MKRRRMSIEEAMNGVKEKQVCVKKQCRKYGIPLYYGFSEKDLITPASFDLCQRMHKMGQLTKAPFPDGEILLLTRGNEKFWISTSRESLIDAMENKKQPLFCFDLMHLLQATGNKSITTKF